MDGCTIKQLVEIGAHFWLIQDALMSWMSRNLERDGEEVKGRKFIEIGVCHTIWILIESLIINELKPSSIFSLAFTPSLSLFPSSQETAWQISIHGNGFNSHPPYTTPFHSLTLRKICSHSMICDRFISIIDVSSIIPTSATMPSELCNKSHCRQRRSLP